MEPIAITGVSFRLPQGVEDEASFWDMLVNGRNTMTDWPASRANLEAFHLPKDKVRNTLSSKGAHFLQGDPGAFDAPFFSITPSDAESMDPQQRWLLETAFRALENAGIPVEKVAGSDTAVFVGSMANDYLKLIHKDPDESPANTSVGTSPAILANRISWYFDLKGPSVQLNTACSSSLIATDLACQCLRSGQSSMALVAGSNTNLTPEESLHLENMNFLSPSSRSYAFDYKANGYGRGEGAIVLVLKRLSDALRNGDMIRALIRASSSNQDGRTPGITQPSLTSQESLIRSVYKSCGLEFTQTRYVEAHGTGTKLGDSTEAKALGQVFRSSRSQEEPLYIGSVKTNIGHLEGASGLAGMIKAIMILERGIIPPNALFEKWSQKINPKFNNLQVPTSCIAWPAQGLRRISVNSFGFGGSNCHLILDDAFHHLLSLDSSAVQCTSTLLSSRRVGSVSNNEDDESRVLFRESALTPVDETELSGGHEYRNGLDYATKGGPNSQSSDSSHRPALPQGSTLLVWSAKDAEGLKRMLSAYQEYFDQHTGNELPLAALAYTLSTRRSLMPWRSYAVVSNMQSLDGTSLSPEKGVRASKETGLAFVFTGQGAQYARMGSDLLVYPAFRESMKRAGEILVTLGSDWELLDELMNSETVDSPAKSQPLCTALQIALVDLLRSFGLIPDAVVGHSSGEIAAAYAIGALSLESALKVAYHRGRLAQKIAETAPKRGAMLSVNIAEGDVDAYLKKISLDEDISVACVNSPFNITLSGEEGCIDKLDRALQKEEIFSRKLPVGVAYHSPTMVQISEDYLSCMGSLCPAQTGDYGRRALMVSSVTGLVLPASAFSKSQYWVDNLVSPVRFADSLEYLYTAGPKAEGLKPISTYVEIGPYGALRRPVTDTLEAITRGGNYRYLSVLSKTLPPIQSTLAAVGKLFAHGHSVSVLRANQQNTSNQNLPLIVDAPQYPFDHSKSYWHETRLSRGWRFRKAVPRTVLGVPVTDFNPLQPRWRKILRISEMSWLKDHVVAGNILFPATGSIGMVIEAARQMTETTNAIVGFRIKEVTFLKPIIIHEDRETEVIIQLRPLYQTYEKVAFGFEVTIYTVVSDTWNECVKSDVCLEYDELPNDVDGEQATSALAKFLSTRHCDAKSSCQSAISQDQFYKSLKEQGFEYGATFTLVRDVRWDCNQLATAHIDAYPTYSNSYEGVVHPGVLDAACQVLYVAPTNGISTKLPTTVPYKMRNVWIAADGWKDPSSRQIHVLTRSSLRDIGIGIECTMSVLSEKGALLFHIEKFDLRPFESARSNHSEARKLVHRIDWMPDLTLLDATRLQQYCEAGADLSMRPSSTSDQFAEMETTLLCVVQSHLSRISQGDRIVTSPTMQKFVSFLQSRLNSVPQSRLELMDEATLDDRLAELASNNPALKIFEEIGKRFRYIVSGQVSGSEILASSHLTQYHEHLLSGFADGPLKPYLELVVHKNPNLRILEIGGGSSAMTKLMLSMLEQIERRTGGTAFRQYHFTDSSKVNCDSVREQYSSQSSRMTFQNINLEQDFLAQGLQSASFDMIIVGGVFLAPGKLQTKLREVHELLRADGHLMFCSTFASENFLLNLAHGILPDWWSAQQMTVSEWDSVLKENMFSGNDMVIGDHEDTTLQKVSIVVSTALSVTQKESNAPSRIVLIVRSATEGQLDVARVLVQDVFHDAKYDTRIFTLEELAESQDFAADYALFLIDIGTTLDTILARLIEPTFILLKRLVQTSANALWVSSIGDSQNTETCIDAYQGIKDGFLRTLRSEFGGKRLASLTLEAVVSETPAIVSQISKVFTAVFVHRSQDLEYFVRQGDICIGRLVEDSDLNHQLSSSMYPELTTAPWGSGPPLRLDIGVRGQLDTLCYVEDKAYYDEIGPTEVEIEAKAWAVNFRDVFGALGRLDDPGFGYDCAGIVRRAGDKCLSLKPGDRVCMCVVDAMRMYPRGDEKATVKIPFSLSFEEACSVIVPGMTALQSLIELAHICPGEKVLIHSAAGATGQMTIQVAQNAGAEVFATVGFADKKDLLMREYGIPSDHIFYSRSDNATFAQSLLRATKGYGVDVVVNSLVSEALRASWECIAPYGRFIELGKADINANSTLPMAKFSQNTTFASVDVLHMLLHRKEAALRLLRKAVSMLTEGTFRHPRPLNVYDLSTVEDAFRYIQGGKNSGRVVIRIDPQTEVRRRLVTPRTWRFEENATYLVAGGLGGIGRSILRWMAARGARHLVVPSRSGLTAPAAKGVVNELTAQGINIKTPKTDVSVFNSISQVLRECAKTMPPIRGCINAAMVLQDSMFDNMSFVQWDLTIRSKVATSWNLDRLLPELDFMVFLSSISGIVGNPGQANYAAGCTFQDALAQARCRRGQKTTSINLSVVRNIGVVAESETLRKRLEGSAQGLGMVGDEEFFALLNVICDPASIECDGQIIIGLDTPAKFLAQSLDPPDVMRQPLFAHFSQHSSSATSPHGSTGGLNSNVLFRQAATAEDRSKVVTESLAHRLAHSLGIKVEDIDTSKPLHAFGVDSLVAVELRNWISREFAADVPVFKLVGGRTVEGVGEFVEKCSQITIRTE